MGTQTKQQLEARILELESAATSKQVFTINAWINTYEDKKTGEEMRYTSVRISDPDGSLAETLRTTKELGFNMFINPHRKTEAHPFARGNVNRPRVSGALNKQNHPDNPFTS